MDNRPFEGSLREQQNESAGKQTENNMTEEVQISQPRTERPEGPFEHSGETSGWTKAEESEKNEQEQD